jgi:hypothetical protein
LEHGGRESGLETQGQSESARNTKLGKGIRNARKERVG